MRSKATTKRERNNEKEAETGGRAERSSKDGYTSKTKKQIEAIKTRSAYENVAYKGEKIKEAMGIKGAKGLRGNWILSPFDLDTSTETATTTKERKKCFCEPFTIIEAERDRERERAPLISNNKKASLFCFGNTDVGPFSVFVERPDNTIERQTKVERQQKA